MTEVELKERIDIETSKEFRIRHEDIYLFLALAIGSFPLHAILLSASKNYPDFRFGIVIALVIFDVLLLGVVIFNSWYHFRERLSETAYIENGRIVKTQKGLVIFDYPLSSIVSVRTQNKKGNEGTIILFNTKESLNYTIMYGMHSRIRLSCHGFTDYKIDFVKNRKWLVTEIYKANPKLHIIESF